MKTIYVPVGFRVNYFGVILTVVRQEGNKPSCLGCFFSKWYRKNHKLPYVDCTSHGMCCTAFVRKDGSHVIFKPKEDGQEAKVRTASA